VLCMMCCVGVGYVKGIRFIIGLIKETVEHSSLLAFYAMSTDSCSYSRGVTSRKTWMFSKTAWITSHFTGIFFFVLGIDRFTCFVIYNLVSLLKIILFLNVITSDNNVLIWTIPCGKKSHGFCWTNNSRTYLREM